MVCALATCPKRSPFDSMAGKRIAKIGRSIFERTIPASFTHSKRGCAGPRGTGKPLQIAVDVLPNTTEAARHPRSVADAFRGRSIVISACQYFYGGFNR